jgi:hypothetical protein
MYRANLLRLTYAKFILVFVFLAFTTGSTLAAERYVCTVEKKLVCSQGVCKPNNPLQDDYRIIDVDGETYQMGSDTVELEGVRQSGVNLYFYIGAASFMKMNDIGSFVEVRDMGLAVITSFGTCKF